MRASIELIFGIILVVMMLFRRDGLIPATRKTAAADLRAAARAEVRRGGFEDLEAGRPRRLPTRPAIALEVRGVTVRFGGLVALNKVDITVPNGGVVAVIGPNGSGKSTLFNVITGLVPAEDGSILFHGEEIIGLPPHEILERGIARTFQNIRLFTNLKVIDNVLIGQHARLHTGILGAILRLPGTRPEEAGAREWALDIFSLFGNRLAPRPTRWSRPVLRQPAPRGDRPRAGVPPESCCWTSRPRA